MPVPKGYKFSEERNKKIGLTHKGKKRPPFSKEWRDNMSKSHKGKKNFRWKGGRKKSKGYIYILKPEHPFCDLHGYVAEHRFVAEDYLRKHEPNHPALVEIKGIKYLRPKWIVHHKGTKYPLYSIENTQDNRIENLQLFPNRYQHMKLHKFLKQNHSRTK